MTSGYVSDGYGDVVSVWRTFRQTAYGAEVTLWISCVNSSNAFDMLLTFYPVSVTPVDTAVAADIHVWARAPSSCCWTATVRHLGSDQRRPSGMLLSAALDCVMHHVNRQA